MRKKSFVMFYITTTFYCYKKFYSSDNHWQKLPNSNWFLFKDSVFNCQAFSTKIIKKFCAGSLLHWLQTILRPYCGSWFFRDIVNLLKMRKTLSFLSENRTRVFVRISTKTHRFQQLITNLWMDYWQFPIFSHFEQY